ncbi:hypothetical protein IBX65_08915 [Candidatus Aerophobetes bacterium]|nr:hypothetical protein [Candidatus Aerophobetes bacterium]
MIEWELIGMLLNMGKLEQAKDKLQKEDFTEPKCWRIYREMHKLEEEYGGFSAPLLNHSLKIDIRYFENLRKCAQATVSSMVPGLIKRMKEERWKRKFFERINYDSLRKMQPREIKETFLTFFSQHEFCSEQYFDINKSLAQAFEFLDSEQESEMMPTPWEKLNELIAGIVKGKVYVVGGRTSAGKSTFLLNLSLFSCFEGKKVLILATEDKPRVLFLRSLTYMSKVSNEHV